MVVKCPSEVRDTKLQLEKIRQVVLCRKMKEKIRKEITQVRDGLPRITEILSIPRLPHTYSYAKELPNGIGAKRDEESADEGLVPSMLLSSCSLRFSEG